MASISSLAGVSSALHNVRDIAANAAKSFAAQRAARSEAQANINAITSTITNIADLASAAAVKQAGNTPNYNITAISPGIAKLQINAINLFPPGQTLDVRAEITRSAQVGALLLSFGGPIIDLNSTATASAGAKFEIEVRGRHGAQTLSFTSGTSLANVRDAINTFTGSTGVVAKVVGQSGIRLESTEYGRDEFVAVRVLNQHRARGSGILTYSTTNNNNASPGSAVAFSTARWGIDDFGQDVEGRFGNTVARGRGLELSPTLAAQLFDGSLFLTVERAQSLGQFHAFTATILPTQNDPTSPNPSNGLPTSPDEAQPPTYSNAGVINPRISSKSVDLRG